MNSGANAECFTTCRVNLCSDGTEGLPSGPTVNVFLTFGNSFFLQALPTILLLVTWLYFRKCTVIHVETKVLIIIKKASPRATFGAAEWMAELMISATCPRTAHSAKAVVGLAAINEALPCWLVSTGQRERP